VKVLDVFSSRGWIFSQNNFGVRFRAGRVNRKDAKSAKEEIDLPVGCYFAAGAAIGWECL
jgi:hypothetical protein